MGVGCHLHQSCTSQCAIMCVIFSESWKYSLSLPSSYLLSLEVAKMYNTFQQLETSFLTTVRVGQMYLTMLHLKMIQNLIFLRQNIKKFNVYPFACICKYLLYVHIISLSTLKLCSIFHCRFIMFLNPGLYHLFFRLCSVHNNFNTNSSSNDEWW